jgi:hypothetical protein
MGIRWHIGAASLSEFRQWLNRLEDFRRPYF